MLVIHASCAYICGRGGEGGESKSYEDHAHLAMNKILKWGPQNTKKNEYGYLASPIFATSSYSLRKFSRQINHTLRIFFMLM